VQPVDLEPRLAIGVEALPQAPFRAERVDAEVLEERREGLIEPDPLPPLHRDQVAEPHVRELVRDDHCDVLELALGRGRGIDEQRRLAERDAAEVLHCAVGEVGDAEEVHLVPGVRDAEVVRVEAQRVCRHLERELAEVDFVGRGDDRERDAVDVDDPALRERPDDDRDEVRGHPHRGGEDHLAATVVELCCFHDR
jgi:hypothetical protein